MSRTKNSGYVDAKFKCLAESLAQLAMEFGFEKKLCVNVCKHD